MTEYEYTDVDGDLIRVVTGDGAAVVGIRNNQRLALVSVPAGKVEEVCAALRDAAGLLPVSTVEKATCIDLAIAVQPGSVLYQGNAQRAGADDPVFVRRFAAALLAAADEAEAAANRPKLPTAADSVVKVNGYVWARGEEYWRRPGSIAATASDRHLASQDFTVLYDPEKAT